MKQHKQNVSKKLPKDVTGSLPYFHINNLSEIQQYLDGGSVIDEDPSLISTLGGGGFGATIGNTISDAIGGNTNIAEDRNAGMTQAVTGGIFEGAGTGFDIGSKFGTPGALIGAGVGAIAGGFNAQTQKKKELKDFRESMEAKYAGRAPETTTYLGAYGGELPDMYEMGGDIAAMINPEAQEEQMEMAGDPTEYNGNTHEEGGIAIGEGKEVEDGEIRVGDYIFSDRLTGADGHTFAKAAKKITDKFKEYENDGPSMRTQDKMLKDLSFQNDQARLQKQKEEAEMDAMMGEDFLAYGGMVKQDNRGRNIVESKDDRIALMEQAKARQMPYNKYVSSLYAYGGKIKDKQTYAKGGTFDGIDPNDFGGVLGLDLPQGAFASGSEAFNNQSGTNPLGTDRYIPKGVAPSVPGDSIFGDNALPGLDLPQSPFMTNAGAFNNQGITAPGSNFEPIELDPNLGEERQNYDYSTVARQFLGGPEDEETDAATGASRKFSPEDQALLASQLPNISNLLMANKRGNTNFERVSLQDVNLDKERDIASRAIERARNTQRANVRGTASSAGEALAALSASNAGLTQAEMDAMLGIGERESNANIQNRNQERLTNVGISGQETIARQQDDAMRDSIKGMALAKSAENYQGYIKDKSLNKENEASNARIMSLLKTGEYEMSADPNDPNKFNVVHKATGKIVGTAGTDITPATNKTTK